MSNQQKNTGLIVGIFIGVFIAYHFSIKKTIIEKDKYTKLLKEKELVDNAVNKLQYLKQKNNSLNDFLISRNVSAESSFQQLLLEKITVFIQGKDISIVAFNQPHRVEKNQTIIETYSFELKGNYIDLLKLINFIEHEQLGEFISVDFEKKKNYKTNRFYLTSTIFLQKTTN